jgi:hypothetical protein
VTEQPRRIYSSSEREFHPLIEAPPLTEDELQELIAKHPELLAGVAEKLLLIARELGVPKTAGGGGWYSLDHLFVDPTGVPTLVEVKRALDARARREVIAQMLDYAANGSLYWSPGRLQEAMAKETPATSPDQGLTEFLGRPDPTFWDQIEKHLKAGRLRLVFVADRISTELVSIIDFLNDQMGRTDVFGIEVTTYVGDGASIVVPTVVARPRDPVDDSSIEHLIARASHAFHAVLGELESWARDRGHAVTKGSKSIRVASSGGTIVNLYPLEEGLEVNLYSLTNELEAEAAELLSRLSALTEKRLTSKYPTLPCKDIQERWPDLEAILDRAAQLISELR